MTLLRKHSHALIRVSDLIALGRVCFMDFQCTPPVMGSAPGYGTHEQLLGFTVAHGLRKFSSVVILAKIGSFWLHWLVIALHQLHLFSIKQ